MDPQDEAKKRTFVQGYVSIYYTLISKGFLSAVALHTFDCFEPDDREMVLSAFIWGPFLAKYLGLGCKSVGNPEGWLLSSLSNTLERLATVFPRDYRMYAIHSLRYVRLRYVPLPSQAQLICW